MDLAHWKKRPFFLVPCIHCPFKRDWIFSLLYFCFSLSSEAREAKCYAVHFVKVISIIKRFVGYQVKSKFILFLFDQMEVRGVSTEVQFPHLNFPLVLIGQSKAPVTAANQLTIRFSAAWKTITKNLWKILDQKIKGGTKENAVRPLRQTKTAQLPRLRGSTRPEAGFNSEPFS